MPPSANLAQLLRGAVNKWNASHPVGQHIDPAAELAIAGHEGLSGGIGDGGHAFGPNQLNDAGGVLTGKMGGTPAQKNAWAWSPQGLEFALRGVAGAAGGESGGHAVRDIATKFERPANVQAEIQDALAHYGGTSSPSRAPMSVGAPAVPPLTSAPTGNPLGQLIAQTNQTLGLDTGPGLAGLFRTLPAALGDHSGSGAKVGGKAGQGQSGLPPLKGAPRLTALDGVRVDSAISPMVQQVIQRFGVSPTSGYRDAAHNAQVGGASNSDHLRGDAVDFGGNPQALAALYKYAQGRFPYVEPMAQAKNHVHISFARPGK